MNGPKCCRDRLHFVVRHDGEHRVIGVIFFNAADHPRMIQGGLPLEMMTDLQSILLQLLSPLTAGQQRYVIACRAKHMRQIAADHAGTVKPVLS